MFVESGSKPERDILSLDSLISWLETKPRGGTYNYQLPCGCLLAQYFQEMTGCKHMGVTCVSYGPMKINRWIDDVPGSIRGDLPDGWDRVARSYNANDKGNWTYGMALQRAMALRAEIEKRTSAPKPLSAGRLLERLFSLVA